MIAVLPPEVVNQIAAGEVIERPFSVVKELVENSLDAGARRIVVELAEGGRELVRVTDDGAGFTADDLELAFQSHATSKLGSLADLDHIASLGFRGEALASIGSISRATIRSRPGDADAGHEVRCTGGALEAVRPCGCPPGTVIEIRDLFFNTPARRRFLRTPSAERARVQELLIRLALARLDVDFTLISEGRTTVRLPAGEELRDRVARAFGDDVAASLLVVERVGSDHQVVGLCAAPAAARRDGKLELLYINGRQAKESSTTYAIRQAYKEFLMHRQLPVYFLMLTLPPDRVDVNVHPRKAEVRFLDGRRVAGLLYEAVRSALSVGGLYTRRAEGAEDRVEVTDVAVDSERPRARSGFPDLPTDLFGRSSTPSLPVRGRAALQVRRGAPTRDVPAAGDPASVANPFRHVAGRFLQVMDLYLLFEGPDGMVVVDQHALHERVLYERFKRRDRARGANTQRLLMPVVVELTPADKEWILGAAADLAAEGFLVDDFGPNSIAVHGLPAALGRADPAEVLKSLLRGDDDGAERPRVREAVVERFHSMACRAAVMSGDRLGDDEIAELLREAATLEHPHNCPHGRPTVLTFSAAELEKYFRRRV